MPLTHETAGVTIWCSGLRPFEESASETSCPFSAAHCTRFVGRRPYLFCFWPNKKAHPRRDWGRGGGGHLRYNNWG